MAIGNLILGNSGVGKSASLRNFADDEVLVFNVNNKPLPFRNKIRSIHTPTHTDVMKAFREEHKNPTVNAIVVDDFNYVMQLENIKRGKETGYVKFTDMAQHVTDMMVAIQKMRDDLIVYFMAHTITDDNGYTHMKTVGKMIDEKLTPEGLFTIVLHAVKDEAGRHFVCNSNDVHSPAKSPMGMFDDVIDNDLKFVDSREREFYDLRSINDVVKPVEVEQIEAPAPPKVQKMEGEK